MLVINKIRGAIRAKFIQKDITIRTQAQIAEISHQSAMRVNKRCYKYGVDHEIALDLTDTQLVRKLYPNLIDRQHTKRLPDLNTIIQELTKSRGKQKTRTVLYLEYRAQDPDTALSRTHFFRLVNQEFKRCKITMKQWHVAGEIAYIDYAGRQVFYMKSGKKVWVKVFLAVLGASKKIFAFATYGEKTMHWIDGMTRMFAYFGGVTEVVSMDNAKALVSTPGLIPVLTKNVDAFGEHYGCLMDTCRVRKPQDKSLVELGVKFVTQRVLVPMMQNHTFFSLDEINHYLTKEVEALNNGPFTGLKVSRNDLFEQNEKQALKPLPAQAFNMIAAQLVQKVPPNYHIKYLKHEYSVPYQLRGNTVEVIVNQSELRIIHEHKEIAVHRVSNEQMGCSTITEHMPAEHLGDVLYTDKKRNLEWARKTGIAVEKITEGWYAKTTNPKSRVMAKRCHALMKLKDKHGENVLSQACEYADSHGMSTPADISMIISAQQHQNGFDNLPMNNSAHQNVRGSDYYGGQHHEA